ncbi:hypothetical protein ACTXT7_009638 [Hymenolepis weldensis]
MPFGYNPQAETKFLIQNKLARVLAHDGRQDYQVQSDRRQPRTGGSIQEIPIARRSHRSSVGYSSPSFFTNLWTGRSPNHRRINIRNGERSHTQSGSRTLPGSAFSPYEGRQVFECKKRTDQHPYFTMLERLGLFTFSSVIPNFDHSRRFSPIGASFHLDASSPSAEKPSLALSRSSSPCVRRKSEDAYDMNVLLNIHIYKLAHTSLITPKTMLQHLKQYCIVRLSLFTHALGIRSTGNDTFIAEKRTEFFIAAIKEIDQPL